METSKNGLDLIKHFEGCELRHINVLQMYGQSATDTPKVSMKAKITQEEADQMLLDELVEYEGYVNNLVEVDLNQNQFDAMVSWVYNLGGGNLKASTL